MAPAFEPAFEKLGAFAESMTEADVRPKSGVGRGEAALTPSAALRKNNEFQKLYAEFASYLDVRARRAAEELRSASNELSSNIFRAKLFGNCLKANAVPASLRSRSYYFLRYCDDQLFEEWESALHETSMSLLHALGEHLSGAERQHIKEKIAEALSELTRPDGELGEARGRKLAAWLEKERSLIEKHCDESAIKSQLNKIVEEYGSTCESHRRARGPPPPPPRRGRSASRNATSADSASDGARYRGSSQSQQRSQQRQKEDHSRQRTQQNTGRQQQQQQQQRNSGRGRGRQFGSSGRSASRGNRH